MKYIFTLFVFLFSFSVANAQQTETIKKDTVVQDFEKFRFGGYGEILFQHMNYGVDRYKDPMGAPKDNRNLISLPRIVFATDYKFRSDIILSSEIEFEYGGTGSAMELEYAEAGEYEMEVEKAGEVMLEQLHITKTFLNNRLNVRVGEMIVPVGITNAHHEPIFYFTTTRPEGEMAMIPCTWHELGIALLGTTPYFNYNLMLVNGLDPNGFSTANWIGGGKQGVFENNVMTNPAFAGRFEFTGVQGLRVGASGYYANSTAKNSSKPQAMTDVTGRIFITSADAQYNNYNIVARANFVYGNLSDSKAISEINRRGFKKTGYPCTPVAEAALTYSVEIGYNVLGFFDTKQKLLPFVHYEYYNTVEEQEAGLTPLPRFERNVLSFGVNYFMIPNLVVKADYGIRTIGGGNYNSENTFGISIGYVAWFTKK